MMHRVLALGLVMLLYGCGFSSPIIKSETMSFDDVIEDTTNKLLVLNVLRARDQAPLHFADIPMIRETIQQTLSWSSLNFYGAQHNQVLRDSFNTGMNFQMVPSFDVNHIQSKEFVTGLATPIDPKFVKYWLDRGLDRRIVLLLFFSAAEIIETRSASGPTRSIKIMNSPRAAIDVIKGRKQPFTGPDELRCDTQSDFERYLKLVNSLKTFFAHSYTERRLLAKNFHMELDKDSIKNLQAFAALDQTKTQLVYDKGRSAYSLYAMSGEPKVAFCFYDDTLPAGSGSSRYAYIKGSAESPGDKNSCFQPVIDAPVEDSTQAAVDETPVFFPERAPGGIVSDYCAIYGRFTGSSAAKVDAYPKLQVRLHMRSVGEMIQFLGDLLRYQDEVKQYLQENAQLNLKLNTPVTFGYCGDNPQAGCDDIFFDLRTDRCNARFTLNYRDKQYSVANFNPPDNPPAQENLCASDYLRRKDHTLAILAVVHQMVNLHRSAADLRSTPTVRVIQ